MPSFSVLVASLSKALSVENAKTIKGILWSYLLGDHNISDTNCDLQSPSTTDTSCVYSVQGLLCAFDAGIVGVADAKRISREVHSILSLRRFFEAPVSATKGLFIVLGMISPLHNSDSSASPSCNGDPADGFCTSGALLKRILTSSSLALATSEQRAAKLCARSRSLTAGRLLHEHHQQMIMDVARARMSDSCSEVLDLFVAKGLATKSLYVSELARFLFDAPLPLPSADCLLSGLPFLQEEFRGCIRRVLDVTSAGSERLPPDALASMLIDLVAIHEDYCRAVHLASTAATSTSYATPVDLAFVGVSRYRPQSLAYAYHARSLVRTTRFLVATFLSRSVANLCSPGPLPYSWGIHGLADISLSEVHLAGALILSSVPLLQPGHKDAHLTTGNCFLLPRCIMGSAENFAHVIGICSLVRDLFLRDSPLQQALVGSLARLLEVCEHGEADAEGIFAVLLEDAGNTFTAANAPLLLRCRDAQPSTQKEAESFWQRELRFRRMSRELKVAKALSVRQALGAHVSAAPEILSDGDIATATASDTVQLNFGFAAKKGDVARVLSELQSHFLRELRRLDPAVSREEVERQFAAMLSRVAPSFWGDFSEEVQSLPGDSWSGDIDAKDTVTQLGSTLLSAPKAVVIPSDCSEPVKPPHNCARKPPKTAKEIIEAGHATSHNLYANKRNDYRSLACPVEWSLRRPYVPPSLPLEQTPPEDHIFSSDIVRDTAILTGVLTHNNADTAQDSGLSYYPHAAMRKTLRPITYLDGIASRLVCSYVLYNTSLFSSMGSVFDIYACRSDATQFSLVNKYSDTPSPFETDSHKLADIYDAVVSRANVQLPCNHKFPEDSASFKVVFQPSDAQFPTLSEEYALLVSESRLRSHALHPFMSPQALRGLMEPFGLGACALREPLIVFATTNTLFQRLFLSPVTLPLNRVLLFLTRLYEGQGRLLALWSALAAGNRDKKAISAFDKRTRLLLIYQQRAYAFISATTRFLALEVLQVSEMAQRSVYDMLCQHNLRGAMNAFSGAIAILLGRCFMGSGGTRVLAAIEGTVALATGYADHALQYCRLEAQTRRHAASGSVPGAATLAASDEYALADEFSACRDSARSLEESIGSVAGVLRALCSRGLSRYASLLLQYCFSA